MKIVIDGTIAALLALWAIPSVFSGIALPAAYGWALALLFVAVDISIVSVRMVRVEVKRDIY